MTAEAPVNVSIESLSLSHLYTCEVYLLRHLIFPRETAAFNSAFAAKTTLYSAQCHVNFSRVPEDQRCARGIVHYNSFLALCFYIYKIAALSSSRKGGKTGTYAGK